MISKFGIVFSLLAIAGQVAAAQTSAGNILAGDVKADVVTRYTGPGCLPKPDEILIQDFAVPVGDTATTDNSIAGRLHRQRQLRHGVDEDSSPQVLARQVQAAFVKALASEMKKVNIQTVYVPTEAMTAENSMPSSVLVVEGEFVAIHEGDETKRIMIGFGRGASDIKTHIEVSSVTQGHATLVLEFNLSSESGKKPGAVATMGIGSLAVGAAAGGVGDRRSNVEADASRMAKLVANQLQTFMAGQKWISNAPAQPPQVGVKRA